MNKLTSLEVQAVAALQADYEKLSLPAKAEVTKGVSWAERNIWIVVAITAGFFLVIGIAL